VRESSSEREPRGERELQQLDDHQRLVAPALSEGGRYPDDVGRQGPLGNQELRLPDGEVNLQALQRWYLFPSFTFSDLSLF
jgi:hypothetical protein